MAHARPDTSGRRAFALLDILITVSVLGVVLLAVAPSLNPDEPMRLAVAATIVSTDVEAAQSYTLASPNDPTVVRLRDEGDGYWLALASDPDTPILKGDTDDPYEVVFGEGRLASLAGVSIAATGLDGDHLEFSALGSLAQGDDVYLVLDRDGSQMGIRIRSSTGSVSLVDPEDLPE